MPMRCRRCKVYFLTPPEFASKGLPTDGMHACMRACVSSYVRACVRAGALSFSQRRPQKCVRVNAQKRPAARRAEGFAGGGRRGEGGTGDGGRRGWRGLCGGSWEKAPRLSREKRRAATRLPRGAQRFASLPSSLQALTHQQSLPPSVRTPTPRRLGAHQPPTFRPPHPPGYTCRSVGGSALSSPLSQGSHRL